VTTYLDDKNENCVDTQSHGVRTFMLKHPYNQPQPGIPVLYNLGQFLDIVAGAIKAETAQPEVASAR
jgi:hypothetical protein